MNLRIEDIPKLIVFQTNKEIAFVFGKKFKEERIALNYICSLKLDQCRAFCGA